VGHQRGSYFEKTAFAPVQNLAQLKSAGGTTFFSFLSGSTYAGTVVADGANQRLAPQGWYYVGPFGLAAEYVQTAHRVKRAGQSEDIRFDAWSTTAGFVLTGEKAAPGKSVVPDSPVGKGIGAWQVVGRLGSVIVDKDAFPKYANPARSARAARAAGVALNWYATANLRTSLAYEKTRFESADAMVPAFPAENFLLARLQLGFL
jgi:phosphate-selective porin OprO/OprP